MYEDMTTDKPPYCNTGAVNTTTSSLRYCIDWVQATLKIEKGFEEIITILGMENETFSTSGGQYGYSSAMRKGGITIFYDGKAGMGTHIQFSGQGCREYEQKGIYKWSELFRRFFEWGMKFTRIDLAIDDFENRFKIPILWAKIKRGECVSKMQHARRMEKVKLDEGTTQGDTIYFGSSDSRVQIRIYDKYLEREGKGKKIDNNINHWVRTELQLRKDRAETTAILLTTDHYDFETTSQGLLKNYVRFTNRSKDKNRSRWKTSRFWENFIGEVERLHLSEIAPDRTIEEIEGWMERQVAPSLAAVIKAYEGDMRKVLGWIKEGNERLTEKHYDMIYRFIEEQEKRSLPARKGQKATID